MFKAAQSGFSLATELADYLAEQGLAFREAHHVVGSLVRDLSQQGRELHHLSLEELQAAHPLFGAEALELTRLESAINRRNSYGGTAPDQVRQAVAAAIQEVAI